MAYRVEISPAALSDVEQAYQWIVARSAPSAVAWFNAALDAISSLEAFPMRCSLVPERRLADRGLRHLLVGWDASTYRIVFRFAHDEKTGDDIVRILRVWHASRRALEPGDLTSG